MVESMLCLKPEITYKTVSQSLDIIEKTFADGELLSLVVRGSKVEIVSKSVVESTYDLLSKHFDIIVSVPKGVGYNYNRKGLKTVVAKAEYLKKVLNKVLIINYEETYGKYNITNVSQTVVQGFRLGWFELPLGERLEFSDFHSYLLHQLKISD